MLTPGKKRFLANGSPEIILDPEGYISVRGRSVGGGSNESDKQISEWISQYLLNPAPVTIVDFSLDYFNRVNARLFITMLRQLDQVRLKGGKLVVNWYYEEDDEDIHEKGESLSKALNIPFNYIETFDILMPELSVTRMMLSV